MRIDFFRIFDFHDSEIVKLQKLEQLRLSY